MVIHIVVAISSASVREILVTLVLGTINATALCEAIRGTYVSNRLGSLRVNLPPRDQTALDACEEVIFHCIELVTKDRPQCWAPKSVRFEP